MKPVSTARTLCADPGCGHPEHLHDTFCDGSCFAGDCDCNQFTLNQPDYVDGERVLLNSSEFATCPVLDAPDNYHFEGRCEDCDVKTLGGLSLGAVEYRYHVGRLTQSQFEAYMYVWALLSPTRSGGDWGRTPEIPNVRRIARKLLRARGVEIPVGLVNKDLSAEELLVEVAA